jgi:hypothetical protein
LIHPADLFFIFKMSGQTRNAVIKNADMTEDMQQDVSSRAGEGVGWGWGFGEGGREVALFSLASVFPHCFSPPPPSFSRLAVSCSLHNILLLSFVSRVSLRCSWLLFFA